MGNKQTPGNTRTGLGQSPVEIYSQRDTGVLHRNAITAVDKLLVPGTLTLTDDGATAGSTLPNSALHVLVSAGNRWGVTGPGSDPGAITPTLNHSIRVAFAQVVGADYYDVFCTTAAAPLWVARFTEAQRATGGFIANAVGTVSAGGSAIAGSFDVGIIGTGLASNVNPFLSNNAYTPATPTAIACANRSRIHALVKLVVTDLRSLPTLNIIPFFSNQISATDWHQGAVQTIYLLTAVGQSLEQDIEIDVDGATNCVILVDTISGQGSAASIWVETL